MKSEPSQKRHQTASFCYKKSLPSDKTQTYFQVYEYQHDCYWKKTLNNFQIFFVYYYIALYTLSVCDEQSF